VKAAWLLATLVLASSGAVAQEKKKAPAKKAAVPKTHAAHSRATPEQIRKFNDLEKKQQR
jgi:hypothetical protein